MPVTSVSSTDTIKYVSTSNNESSAGLSVGTDTFLKLLVAQLQYQDPLEPQTDTAFVTQLAQMTSLEQMQQMNMSLSSSQANDMIGKYVYAETIDSDTGIENCYLGLVDSVVIKDGTPYVVIGNTAIAVSDVLQIFDGSVFETETTEPETTEPETTEADTSETDTSESQPVPDGSPDITLDDSTGNTELA